jgi:3-methyladenine DNA glycosylase AlkC
MSNYDLAQNPNTPPETLERLVNDKDWEVRCHVANNSNTSTEALERLANDKDWRVRYYVANNINTPQYIKDYLKIKEYYENI